MDSTKYPTWTWENKDTYGEVLSVLFIRADLIVFCARIKNESKDQ
jgi:hypothetical protein